MEHPRNLVRNTLRARAEVIARDIPKDAIPPEGEKNMCRQCEKTFGENDEITKIIVCRSCYISLEAERLFVGKWYDIP